MEDSMTLDEQSQAEIRKLAQTTKIIVVALSSGVLMFAVFVLSQSLPDAQAPLGTLTLLCTVFAFAAIVMRFVIPRIIVHRQIREIANGTWQTSAGKSPNVVMLQTTAGKLAAVFQMKTIIGCALLEGASFFALIALMIEQHIASLVVAVILFLGLLLQFPSTDGITDWVEQHLRSLDEQGKLSR
jgi:hypothetical protein